jgi:flagella basal body P-ring formation protein FlgA
MATIASIGVLLFAVAVIGQEVLMLGSHDNLMPIQTTNVVLASRPIEAGTLIEAEMITVRTVPSDASNSMAFTERSEVLGKAAAIDILALQPLAPNLLVEE